MIFVWSVFYKELLKFFNIKKAKCRFSLKEIKYKDNIFNEEDMSSDDSKRKTIQKMSEPKHVKDLQRFLGMVNCLGKFFENLSFPLLFIWNNNEKRILGNGLINMIWS